MISGAQDELCTHLLPIRRTERTVPFYKMNQQQTISSAIGKGKAIITLDSQVQTYHCPVDVD